jgi:SAM-dependent methyltransferase
MNGDVREMDNVDEPTVEGFGDEWTRFDHSQPDHSELAAVFDAYFSEFPWKDLPAAAVGADFGCGSGRWARYVAPRVGVLYCVDASAAALAVARRNLSGHPNCRFVHASVDGAPIDDRSRDFAYSLGVLHHVPDTAQALAACVRKLRPGAPFLVYLYYAFDNRGLTFRLLWRSSDLLRRGVCRLPLGARALVADFLAAAVYFPLARGARVVERTGCDVSVWPLSFYRDKSFYRMRNDALDRFGTRLERRFRRTDIARMMHDAGLTDVRFREGPPYWCAVGRAR